MVSCVSLFSGGGGLDVGAVRAGAIIAACIENEPDAAETLRQNFGVHQTRVIETDVQEVDFTDWRHSEGGLLIGGPPCQPFSKNGYWIKNKNRLIAEDPRNLLGQFLRAVSEMRPAGFLFENVESILHPTNRETFQNFVNSAETLGYTCTIFRTSSADFGVPQKRKRVFVFGIKGHGMPIPTPVATHVEAPAKDLLESRLLHEGVGKFIEKFSGNEYAEPQEDASHGTYYHELVNVPAGGNYIDLAKLSNYTGKTFRAGGRFWNFLQKLHPDKPSITIAAQPGPWVGPFHWTNRRLRVPEIAAIQTFPEDYIFVGNRRSIQRQIGNAVPCLLAEKMVMHLIKHLP